MTNTKTYTVDCDGWIAGKFFRYADDIELSEAHAKYEPVTLKDVRKTTFQNPPTVEKTDKK